MTEVYQKEFSVTAADVDPFDRLRGSRILAYLQEVAGDHSKLLGTDRAALEARGLFWAVIRHRVQILRLPHADERVRVQTWPMPTTRSAYPRATVMLDENGRVLLKAISLWVLMETESRRMVLPAKSGVEVSGIVLGDELEAPGSPAPKELENCALRQVYFTDLDRNGHMNNCRYADWVADALPSDFHRAHPLKELAVYYLNECREGDQVQLHWQLDEGNLLTVHASRENPRLSAQRERVFSTKMQF